MENNVLIINADEDEALEIKVGLINKNAIVYCASTIQLALNMFMKHNFNLIILDACMSADDDHKLLKAMRIAKSTPILILSSKPTNLIVFTHYKQELTHIWGNRIPLKNV